MGTPLTGDGHPDPSEVETPRRPRPRIETLADLIFGLSLAIDAIALLPTAATTPGDMNSRILIFSFAFLFLITAWLLYTTYMSVLPVDTLAVTFLNVVLLLLVALIPYLLSNVELGDNPAIRDYSSSLFALDLSGILAILAVLPHILGREDNRLVHRDAPWGTESVLAETGVCFHRPRNMVAWFGRHGAGSGGARPGFSPPFSEPGAVGPPSRGNPARPGGLWIPQRGPLARTSRSRA